MTDDESPLERLTTLLENQRNRWRVWFGAIAILLAAIGLNQIRISNVASEAKIAAHAATHAAKQAQDANRLLIAQRTESRLNTCLKDRKFANAHNKLVYTLAHSDPDRSATDQARIDALAAEQYVAVPDCSPEGIAAFYAGQGTTTVTIPASTSTTLTTAKPRPHRPTTSTTQPTTSTRRPPVTSTTYPSSPTTVPTPCTGVSIPGGLPCL